MNTAALTAYAANHLTFEWAKDPENPGNVAVAYFKHDLKGDPGLLRWGFLFGRGKTKEAYELALTQQVIDDLCASTVVNPPYYQAFADAWPLRTIHA